jgi:hypothetical protein
MKKRLNVIVLALEIAAIVVLHAVKINQSDKKPDTRNPSSEYSSINLKQPLKTDLPYILIHVK